MRLLFFLTITVVCNAQNINVNNDFYNGIVRFKTLNGDISTTYSLNVRPINTNISNQIFNKKFKILYNNKNKIKINSLGIDYFLDFNSHHPYSRNNGTMIPNRGYQHIISPGLFLKIGPLSAKIKPEHHFSENKRFDGFWEGHADIIWSERYKLWNHIDMPERFGEKQHNKTTIGQSNIKLNWKSVSIGISNENLWWGPSIRNSIMMSNHAQGFRHITFNSNKPIQILGGHFEWQLISGRLENSGFTPPKTNLDYAGQQLYVPKINQNGKENDWRYLQAYIFSYSPKFIDGFSFGFMRWVQMYSALVEGKYTWIDGNNTYFPIFSNLFRKKDKFSDYEAQTDQAAGAFFKWIWKDSKAEIYAEFHYNDAKLNLRDFILDSDHSRAATIGIQKIFLLNQNNYLFSWEWTQMEQTAGRLVRNAGSWYEHSFVYHGYTNKGEVLGSSIGPGSNSHYISISKIKDYNTIGLALEVVDQDNDFYNMAFSRNKDFRRYWKDINIHLNYQNLFDNFSVSANFVYQRSLNYQWELDENIQPYYHPGRDVNNFHLNLKLTYFGPW